MQAANVAEAIARDIAALAAAAASAADCQDDDVRAPHCLGATCISRIRQALQSPNVTALPSAKAVWDQITRQCRAHGNTF